MIRDYWRMRVSPKKKKRSRRASETTIGQWKQTFASPTRSEGGGGQSAATIGSDNGDWSREYGNPASLSNRGGDARNGRSSEPAAIRDEKGSQTDGRKEWTLQAGEQATARDPTNTKKRIE